MWRHLRGMLLLAVAATLVAPSARAGSFEITPYYGYRLGGEFTDFGSYSGGDLEIKEGVAWGIILTLNLNPASQVEFQYSQQSTALVGSGFVIVPAGSDLLDLNVENWLLGWTYTGGAPRGQARGFGGVCLGVTNFEPETPGFEGDTQFAFGIYGGVKITLAKHFAFRLQGQWVTTWVGSNPEVFCDPFGFCYTFEDASYLYQVELAAGVTLRF